MLEMVTSLMANAGSVIAVAYLLSLTYTDWRPNQTLQKKLLRSVIAAVAAILLMFQPFVLSSNVQIDLRLVSLIMVSLRYGIRFGMLASLPVLAVQYGMGNLTATQAFGLALVTAFTVLGIHRGITGQQVVLTRTCLQLPLLVFFLTSFSALLQHPPRCSSSRFFRGTA